MSTTVTIQCSKTTIQTEPETHKFPPTPHVPNSSLPVLVYRSVLPLKTPELASIEQDVENDSAAKATQAFIERNNWLQGGIFKHFPTAHFHSVTHEIYAVFHGVSTFLLGVGPLDMPLEASAGAARQVALTAGDVIVLPAGVAHRNIASSDDYMYAGLYPRGAPHYDNNWCKAEGEELRGKWQAARAVPIPEWDPVYGRNGPLCRIWREAAAADYGAD